MVVLLITSLAPGCNVNVTLDRSTSPMTGCVGLAGSAIHINNQHHHKNKSKIQKINTKI